MNNVTLVGRLTRDPELRMGTNAVTRFNIAVDRRIKAEGQPEADFINCVAFGKTAEFINKYFQKGMKIGVTGRIQTGSYKDKDGKTVYTTDVVIETSEFVESLNRSESAQTPQNQVAANEGFAQTAPHADEGFVQADTLSDEGLPFK